MTGNQLKTEIKKANLTQEKAAEMLGVTRATFNNWCKQAELPNNIVKNVNTVFGLNIASDNDSYLIELVKSQQETIKSLSETIKNLTSK